MTHSNILLLTIAITLCMVTGMCNLHSTTNQLHRTAYGSGHGSEWSHTPSVYNHNSSNVSFHVSLDQKVDR